MAKGCQEWNLGAQFGALSVDLSISGTCSLTVHQSLRKSKSCKAIAAYKCCKGAIETAEVNKASGKRSAVQPRLFASREGSGPHPASRTATTTFTNSGFVNRPNCSDRFCLPTAQVSTS